MCVKSGDRELGDAWAVGDEVKTFVGAATARRNKKEAPASGQPATGKQKLCIRHRGIFLLAGQLIAFFFLLSKSIVARLRPGTGDKWEESCDGKRTQWGTEAEHCLPAAAKAIQSWRAGSSPRGPARSLVDGPGVFSWSPKKQDSERSQTQTARTSTVGQAFLVGVILS